MYLSLRSGFRLANLTYRPNNKSAEKLVVLLKGSSLSNAEALSELTGLLITSLTKLPSC